MATFDINDVARRVQYVSTGQDGPYAFNFQVNQASELLVYRNDTAQTDSLQYNATIGGDGTGSITFIDNSGSGGTDYTPVNGDIITIIGDQALGRTTVFTTGQISVAGTLETEFDNVVIRQQQIKEITDRSIQLKPTTGRTVTGSGTSGPLYFPYDSTVANNANRVLKYDSNGTSLELGSTSTNIDALAAIADDITTVSGISSNVTTVAGIASNVTSVASNASNINTVATNIANVNTVAGISSDVTAVAAIDAEIAALSGVSAADLSTVAGISSEISTVSGISSNVTTVAGISGNVTTVAGISSDVSTVSGISANTTTVAGISGNVTTVAGISSDVSTVAGISANVTTVAGDTTNIGTVASNITNVNTVATNIADVNNFAEVYRISASAPTTSLDVGDLYFDTTDDVLKVYSSSGWQNAGSSVNGTSARFQYDVSSSTTTITGADKNGETLAYDAGYVDVYLNGIKMVNGSDVTVTSGTSVVFATAIGTSGTDSVDIIAYGTFNVAAISASAITSGTLGYARGGTGLGTLGSADEVLQVNAGGNALEYGKVDTANIADNAVTSAKIADNNVGAAELNVSGNGTSGQVLASDGDGTFSWADASSPFNYNAVTGTTPSLDVGTYNFFDNGTLSGNTTLSFTNVPTEAKWQYTAKGGLGGAFDIGTAWSVDTGQTHNFGGTTTSAYEIDFNDDGTKIFLNKYATNQIFRFPLTTAYDLTTVASSDQSLTYTTNTPAALGFRFSTDGTKLYLAQNAAPFSIEQYNLSTAFDLTTASYSATFNVTGQAVATPYCVAFSSNGTKMYVGDTTKIYQYSLSTAWSVSTASYDSTVLNTGTGGSYPLGTIISITFNNDGTELFATGPTSGNGHIRKYTLTTAYDISTASYDSERDLGFADAYSAKFDANGTKLFYLNQSNYTVYRANTGSFATLTLPASVQNSSAQSSFTTERVTYDFYTADGGTNVYLIGEEII